MNFTITDDTNDLVVKHGNSGVVLELWCFGDMVELEISRDVTAKLIEHLQEAIDRKGTVQ